MSCGSRVNSTNQSSSEYKTGAQMNAWMRAQGAAQKAVLIDGDSATGMKYAAKTTPHMFVIDPKGEIVYAGAIDDKRSTRLGGCQDREQLCARRTERSDWRASR